MEARLLPEVQAIANALDNPAGVDEWLRYNWRVVPDPPDVEYIRTPHFQLRLAAENGFLIGDCDEAATLAAALLAALSWPCTLVAIRLHGDSEFSHVFTRTEYHSVYIDIDPIVPADQLPIERFEEAVEMSVP